MGDALAVNREPRPAVLVAKALGKGLAVLVLSVVAIMVLFALILGAVMGGVFG